MSRGTMQGQVGDITGHVEGNSLAAQTTLHCLLALECADKRMLLAMQWVSPALPLRLWG